MISSKSRATDDDDGWVFHRPAISSSKIIDQKLLRQMAAEGLIEMHRIDDILDDADVASDTPGWRLVNAELIDENEWVQRIAGLFGLASAEIADFTIDRDLYGLIPEELASRFQFVPLTRTGNQVYLGITDPRAIEVYDHIKTLVDADVVTVVLPPSQVGDALRRHYMAHDTSDLEHIEVTDFSEINEGELFKLREGGESEKIVELVDRIFAHAISHSASDIHIEPIEGQVRIRFRVDGILRHGPSYSGSMAPWIVSRIKVLAKLDIAERFLPQDGRVRTRMAGQAVDLRVSSIPVAQGEKVVVRLLGHGRINGNLDGLGFDPETLKTFRRQLRRPQGLILVTGPTGSGKSTTLYGALQETATDEVNVITVEDPIEYEIAGLNQVPINKKRGVTFARALKAILRQDPDVIMLGEIRDTESGIIAAEASVTGHLVLSTLHTNDAPSAVHRLMEMGVPRHLVAPSLQAVIAQRLVRQVCTHCKHMYVASDEELDSLVPGAGLSGMQLAQGRGCGECEGTGHQGRIAVHELLVVDDHMRQLIGKQATTMELRQYAISQGMRDLRTSALELLFAGLTTPQEFFRTVNI